MAQVNYHPALKTLRLYENFLSDDVPEYIWPFQRGNIIGGLLETKFVIERGRTYYVDRDIYIFPDKVFMICLYRLESYGIVMARSLTVVLVTIVIDSITHQMGI